MPPFTTLRIVPLHADQWAILGATGEPVGADFYRSRDLAIEAAQKLAKEGGEEPPMIVTDAHGTRVDVDEGQSPRRSGPPVSLTLDVSPDFLQFLDRLAVRMGVDREEAVRLSLGLMWIAQEAKREGNGLAIVTPDLEIDQEIGLD